MNPIKIWEVIDTQEETGCNCLTKLAIHILSVVTNSAGCKHAFSHMGLVHTGICSKLGVEKVHKTTMVRMDIKQMHVEASLLHAQGKWDFTPQEANTTSPQANNPDIGNSDHDDLLDFV